MDFKDFHISLLRKMQETEKAINVDLALKIESIGLKFVDDNFRNQSWEGQAWQASDGTILVKSGALRRGMESEVSNAQVKFTNDVPYAAPNNEGFEDTVTVKSFKRAKFKKSGAKKKKVATGVVRSHSRKMKVPRRQFAPSENSPSPTFNKSINELITVQINNLLTK